MLHACISVSRMLCFAPGILYSNLQTTCSFTEPQPTFCYSCFPQHEAIVGWIFGGSSQGSQLPGLTVFLVPGRKKLSSESGFRTQPRGAKIRPGQVARSHLLVHSFLLPHELLSLVLLQEKVVPLLTTDSKECTGL